jgi:hypothetical protein
MGCSRAGQEHGPGRAQVVDERLLVLLAGNERRPTGKLFGPMQVAEGDARQPGLRDPTEELTPVEELDAIEEPASPPPAPHEVAGRKGTAGVGPQSCGCAATIAAPAARTCSIAAAGPSSMATRLRSPTATACAARSGSGSL